MPRRAVVFLFLSAAIGVLLFSRPSESRKKIKYCVYVYMISEDIPVCAQYPLTNKQLAEIEDQFGNAVWYYREFLKKRGIEDPEETIPLKIYFITWKLMQDATVFKGGNHGFKAIAGRYIPKHGWMFLTKRVFRKTGAVDLAHELAHWINDNAGITNAQRDEALALRFERYYRRQTK